MMDYIVTMQGVHHMHKFRCQEIDADDSKNSGDKASDKESASKSARYVVFVLILLLVIMQVWAIKSAASGIGKSTTYNADIVMSVMSPLMYWILRWLRFLGPVTKRAA